MPNKMLERIARHLIIYFLSLEKIGSMDEKTGIAIFFIKRVEVHHFLIEYFHFRQKILILHVLLSHRRDIKDFFNV